MNLFQSQARILKVLAHPTRLRLLNALGDGEECVCHLTALVRLRQAYVSQQLMFLRQAGLLADRKEGARVYYRIKNRRLVPMLRAMNVIGEDKTAAPERSRLARCPCPKCETAKAQARSKRRASTRLASRAVTKAGSGRRRARSLLKRNRPVPTRIVPESEKRNNG